MRASPDTAAVLPTVRSKLWRPLASMPVRLAMTCVRCSLSAPPRSPSVLAAALPSHPRLAPSRDGVGRHR
jgi:hypothetical protein